MNQQEYKDKIKEIKIKCNQEIREIHKQYAESNNIIKIGDKIRDHYQFGEVINMTYQLTIISEFPEMLYFCKKLNKDGKEPKRSEKISIYQSNLKEINGVIIK